MTKTDQVLNHLKSGQTLTVWQICRKFRINNPPDVIYSLRRKGWNIIAKTKRGNGASYAIYRLGRPRRL